MPPMCKDRAIERHHHKEMERRGTKYIHILQLFRMDPYRRRIYLSKFNLLLPNASALHTHGWVDGTHARSLHGIHSSCAPVQTRFIAWALPSGAGHEALPSRDPREADTNPPEVVPTKHQQPMKLIHIHNSLSLSL